MPFIIGRNIILLGRKIVLLCVQTEPIALTQMTLPPPIRVGWSVRSWVQDPLDRCVSYQLRKLHATQSNGERNHLASNLFGPVNMSVKRFTYELK